MPATVTLTAGSPTVPGLLSLEISITVPTAGDQYIVTATPTSLPIDANSPFSPMFEVPAGAPDPYVHTVTVDATSLNAGDTVTVTVTDPSAGTIDFDIVLTAPAAPPGGGGGAGGGGTGGAGGGGGSTTATPPPTSPPALPPIHIDVKGWWHRVTVLLDRDGRATRVVGATGTTDTGQSRTFKVLAIVCSLALCALIIGGGMGFWWIVNDYKNLLLNHEEARAVSTDVELLAKCANHLSKPSAQLTNMDLLTCQADLLAEELGSPPSGAPAGTPPAR